jgi:hypothetical protein
MSIPVMVDGLLLFHHRWNYRPNPQLEVLQDWSDLEHAAADAEDRTGGRPDPHIFAISRVTTESVMPAFCRAICRR